MPTLKEFRFDDWVNRAKNFTETLVQRVPGKVECRFEMKPTLSVDALDSLDRKIGHSVPAALRSFLGQGAGGVKFSYRWNATGEQAAAIKSIYEVKDYVWGGGDLCQSSKFAEWFRDCKEWAEETWVAEYPEDLAFWTQSFPILRMDTGDFLGLDCRKPTDDPAVVYLSHDDESRIIAPSFTAFLTEWERLHYIGPDTGLLDEYFDEKGFLNAATEKAMILKKAFGDAV